MRAPTSRITPKSSRVPATGRVCNCPHRTDATSLNSTQPCDTPGRSGSRLAVASRLSFAGLFLPCHCDVPTRVKPLRLANPLHFSPMLCDISSRVPSVRSSALRHAFSILTAALRQSISCRSDPLRRADSRPVLPFRCDLPCQTKPLRRSKKYRRSLWVSVLLAPVPVRGIAGALVP